MQPKMVCARNDKLYLGQIRYQVNLIWPLGDLSRDEKGDKYNNLHPYNCTHPSIGVLLLELEIFL